MGKKIQNYEPENDEEGNIPSPFPYANPDSEFWKGDDEEDEDIDDEDDGEGFGGLVFA